MKTFKLELVWRDGAAPARDVTFLDVPAEDGRLTVLAGHQPAVCLLKAGRVFIDAAEGTRETWTVAGGTLCVTREVTTILTSRAERQDS